MIDRFLLLWPGARHNFSDVPYWERVLIFWLTTAAALILLFIVLRREYPWDSGVFPPRKKYTRSNQMLAYYVAAVSILKRDWDEVGSKLAFIKRHFTEQFPDVVQDFEVDYKNALSRNVSLKSIAGWLVKYQSAEENQAFLIFLMNLCYVDKQVNELELQGLQIFTAGLGLDWKEVQQCFADQDQLVSASGNGLFMRACLRELGLSAPCSIDQIEQAYSRQLNSCNLHSDVNSCRSRVETAYSYLKNQAKC